MNWNDLTTVKKGDLGESLVDKYLIEQGYIPYAPVVNTAHPFDRLVASKDKKELFIAETKTKELRIKYPDSGFPINHYEQYLFVQDRYKIEVRIYFVDAKKKMIYGNTLTKLANPCEIDIPNKGNVTYPLKWEMENETDIIYFPYINMVGFATITNEDVKLLKKFTTVDDNYKTEFEW